VSTKKWMALSALAGVVVVAVLALTKPQPDDMASPHATQAKPTTGLVQGAGDIASTPMAAASLPVNKVREMGSPLDSVAPPACRTTSSGDLVIDPQTRTDVELVVALYKHDEALRKLGDACKDQSPKAQRAMTDLYQQYVQYSQSITQTFPVEEQKAIPLDKLQAVLGQGLHDLRVQYFGADKACAMFCEEEELTKRMLSMAVAYKQKHPNASTEEAVGHAQEQISAEMAAKEEAKESGKTKP
jgi:hypothetical protein